MTPEGPQPFDAGNSLLAEVPASLTMTMVSSPGGQRLLLTIRTASTTLTVLLNGADAKTWAANLDAAAAQMSGSGLVAAAAMPPGSL